MIKIGITGSLASGKSTVSKILSKKKYPLFSADKEVKKLYTKSYFTKKVRKLFRLKKNKLIKKQVKKIIAQNGQSLKILESLIHPIVRSKMDIFIKTKKKKKILFFEIPLLIESKLMKRFDVIFFVKATKKIRLKRYLLNGGKKNIFSILDKRQINASVKANICDHVIHNNSSLKVLEESVKNLIKKYE